MRKAVRRACVFLTVCCCFVFSFIGYGVSALPEELTVNGSQLPVLSAPYTAQEEGFGNGPASAASLPNREQQAAFKLFGLFPVKSARITATKRSYVQVGGNVFGIKLYTRGVLVAKTDLVSTENGSANPALKAGLRGGDLITGIDGRAVNRKSEVAGAIENSGGTPLLLTVERDGAELQLSLQPVKSASGDEYLAGLWIRDSSAGIGTVTFFDGESNTIAGLGHAICDIDSGEMIPISGGELVDARIMGCYKGVDGTPGELCGVFESRQLAALRHNGVTGVYGELVIPPEGDTLPVALRTEVRAGPAQVLVTLDSEGAKCYDVEITRVSLNTNASQKNMTLRVTDPRLIAATGGIVQGMSGSPLVQDGMLVGAVTHVFISSPLEGYAIFAQTMLETARSLKK